MPPRFKPHRESELGTDVINWVTAYLTTDSPEITRPSGNSVVCPFMKQSMDSGHFYLSYHPEVTGESERELDEVLLQYIPAFLAHGPFGGRAKKKSLAVVFPSITPERSHVLDGSHRRLKSAFVSNGLMIAQFHPTCDVRSVHNAEFRVAIAPVPLMAVRHMSKHDHIFLREDPAWMAEYHARFPTVSHRANAHPQPRANSIASSE